MPPVAGRPGIDRSLSGLGLVAFVIFLAGGLAVGIALRDQSPDRERAERVRPSAAAAKPNVVVVMTDDQTRAQMRALPRTRKLIGRTGVEFGEFYVTDPLCCPSRATFLTGQYAHNTGVISNVGPNALAALDEQNTLAVWLQRAGYRTAFVGEYLNDYGLDDPERVPPGWAEWHALVEPTTQNYFDYEMNENGSIRRYGNEPDDYKTRVLGHLAVDAINHAANGDRPLFLYLGFNAPHAPSTPAPRDAGSYEDAGAPRSPAFDEADVADKPRFIRDRPRLDQNALARIDVRNERALESLTEVDRQVGRIVEQLRRKQQLGNTYLVFTSDNGYVDGDHRVEFGKLLPYEPSSRVPLLVRGPEIPSGETSEALVGNIDLAPTIAAIAEADPTLEVDGRSLMPFATEPSRTDDRPLLIESLVRDRSAYYGLPYEAIRAGDLLYVEYSTGDEELYDLAEDPFELESLAADPRFAATRRALAARLAELAQCRGARSCGRPLAHVPVPRHGDPGARHSRANPP